VRDNLGNSGESPFIQYRVLQSVSVAQQRHAADLLRCASQTADASRWAAKTLSLTQGCHE